MSKQTTYYILTTLSKILAPFAPFIADIIYKNLTKEESVHLTNWPDINLKLKTEDLKLVEDMQKVREIVEKAHSQRKEKGIPVRQPLRELIVSKSDIVINKNLISFPSLSPKSCFHHSVK